MFCRFLKLSLFFFLILIFCFAQIPNQINYQGYLSDKEQNPLNGEFSIEFLVYNQAEGGNPVWSESHDVNVKQGNFNVILGALNPISDEIFSQEETYLAIKIGEDPEMSPRKKITSVIYAFKAAIADSLKGLNTADFIK